MSVRWCAPSMWMRSTPAYAREIPSPKAALALVRRATDMIGTPPPIGMLAEEISEYEEQVEEMISSDDDLPGYVRRLEQMADDAASLLGAVGLPDLVTGSFADYEAEALALARDETRLGAIRARLAANRATAPLFDPPRYTRGYEAALARMVDLHDAGRPPEAFAV